MASEARALLDEQIAALNALRDAAYWAYMGAAALPTMARHGDKKDFASYVAKLTVGSRTKLNECLDRAEHWLGPTNPVYVPIPGAEGDCPSACGGAANLLQQLAVLAVIDAGTSDSLPEDADALARALATKFDNAGISDWVWSAPGDELQRLADVVRQETDAAIAKAANEFRAAQFNGIGPTVDALASRLFNPGISDAIAAADQSAYRPGEASVGTKAKQRGRKKADYPTVQREAQVAADWKQAKEAGVYKPDFAKQQGMTPKDLDALLTRVRKRNSRAD